MFFVGTSAGVHVMLPPVHVESFAKPITESVLFLRFLKVLSRELVEQLVQLVFLVFLLFGGLYGLSLSGTHPIPFHHVATSAAKPAQPNKPSSRSAWRGVPRTNSTLAHDCIIVDTKVIDPVAYFSGQVKETKWLFDIARVLLIICIILLSPQVSDKLVLLCAEVLQYFVPKLLGPSHVRFPLLLSWSMASRGPWFFQYFKQGMSFHIFWYKSLIS